MGIILSVYSESAFKEYLLPAVVNEEYSIILEQNIFNLNKDTKLNLEISEYQWSFVPSADYRIEKLVKKGEYAEYKGECLENDDLFRVCLAGGKAISVMVEATDVTFSVLEKYEIKNNQTIRIGSADTNDICYNKLNLVSWEHAVIYRKNGGSFIDIKENSNGAFINFKRHTGTRQLEFGDHINIFGLDIMYLGEIIAVNAAGKNIIVKQENFKKYIPAKTIVQRQKKEESDKDGFFHRSPRQIYKLADDAIEIEAPPAPKELSRRPLFMVIGPSLTMTIPMLLGCGMSIYSASAKGTGGGNVIKIIT